MTDVLAASGLDRTETVRAMTAAWRGLLDGVRPSLLMTDFVLAGALAARGRIPVLQAGFGYGPPPDHLDRLPPLHAEEAVLDAVDRALEASGDPPLARLAEVFAGTRSR